MRSCGREVGVITCQADIDGRTALRRTAPRVVLGRKAAAAYGKKVVSERHRHRYEFNNKYRAVLEKAGAVFSGINPHTDLVEIMELKDHPFFVGVQFHPEFQSRPDQPHPLFQASIRAAAKKRK